MDLSSPEALAEYQREHPGWEPPAGTDPEQWWFWTPEWQAGEKEADLEAGGSPVYYNVEDFIQALKDVA